jgi:hypothetical protein
MSGEIIAQLGLPAAIVLVAAIICGAALSAWRGWLDLKRIELQQARSLPVADQNDEDQPSDTGALIELAAVKERLRRLEAIANGVEL